VGYIALPPAHFGLSAIQIIWPTSSSNGVFIGPRADGSH